LAFFFLVLSHLSPVSPSTPPTAANSATLLPPPSRHAPLLPNVNWIWFACYDSKGNTMAIQTITFKFWSISILWLNWYWLNSIPNLPISTLKRTLRLILVGIL
jgi:hypothetical protein